MTRMIPKMKAVAERNRARSQEPNVDRKIPTNTNQTFGKSEADPRAWTPRWKLASRPF